MMKIWQTPRSGRHTKRYVLFFLLFAVVPRVSAQELNCTVKVLHEKIQKVDQKVFTSLQAAITDFLNNRKWTGDDYKAQEKIGCNVLLNITGNSDSDPDLFTGTLSISTTRPVYNSGYTTTLYTNIDRDVVFHYSQFNPLSFDDNRVTGSDPLESNLTAILAYYAYLVLGLDYDSFSPDGGTALLKKAQNVVTNAPENGTIHGWKAFEEKRNRYWIIDQLLSPRYANYRTAWYSYHRQGLDQMWNKPDEGRKKILSIINSLQEIARNNPNSTLLQAFFNAKADELIRIIQQGTREEKEQYHKVLIAIDPTNTSKYNALK